jgi:3-hydroxyisobutyrate dehydrogenase-like beta-hydroxyacid dehydrogenase
MAKIAWFGAGMMGAGFVEALRRRGEDVTVWNRTFERAQALERFGARAVADPRDALAGADRVHIILSDDAAVDALLDRLDGGIAPGTPVIDHTTVAPGPTAARFARMAQREVEFLHAPVFMSPQGCREGQGIMLVAGPEARFARVADDLKSMIGSVWYTGERPDKAAALKLCGNQMIFFVTAGLADIYAMARAAGVSAPEAHELFAHFQPTAAINVRGKKMAEGDFSPAFELAMARKDARLMLETARAGDVELQVLPSIVERFDELIAAGHGREDLGVLAIDAISR